MRRIQLKTVGQSEHGTFGALVFEAVPFALTLELPWHDNAEDISCIPGGLYLCKRIVSPHFGDVFEIQNVPGRSHILLHKANFLSDLKGCVAVGEHYDGPHERPFLADSKNGFDRYMALVAFESEFELSVIR